MGFLAKTRLEIIDHLKKLIPSDRFAHSLRVEKEAIKLAKHYKTNSDRASIAALLHDCGRFVPADKLVMESKKWGIIANKTELFQPKLLHAGLGAKVAKKIFGIKDKKILSAIAKHTVGSINMTILEKIIYLADHIESGRRFNGVKKIRELAYKNMDKAIVLSTSLMVKSLLESGYPISEQTVRTRNYYVMSEANNN